MDRDTFERIFGDSPLLGPHTLDSPVRYEVWRDFAMRPGKFLDLLLEPKDTFSAQLVGTTLFPALLIGQATLDQARLAVSDDVVIVSVNFEQFVRLILPLTDWASLVVT